MSGRVNVKFVVLLSVVLIAALGAAVWGTMTVLMKSGEDHARLAQKAQDEGNWKVAEHEWGTAVAEERTNLPWLEAYLNAIQQKPTATSVEYQKQFDKYRAVLRSIAEVKRTDQAAHEFYLDEMLTMIRSGPPRRESYEALIGEIDRIGNLLYDQQDSDLWKSLRRYRGEAIATMALFSNDVSDEQFDLAIEDLTSAQQARPDDPEIADALYNIYANRASAARLEDRRQLEEEYNRKAHEVVQAFHDANPESIAGDLLLLRSDISQALRDVSKLELFGADQINARRKVLDTFQDRMIEIADKAQNTDSDQLTIQTLTMLTSLLPTVTPDQAIDRLVAVWNRAAEERPDDPRVQFGRGMFFKRANLNTEAIKIFEQIASLPDLPVSANGMRRYNDRVIAKFQIADSALSQLAMVASQPEAKQQWLETARSAREELANEIPIENPMMEFIDARLAMAEGDLAKADRLFRSYNTATNESNAIGLRLSAEVAGRLGNPGLERQLLEKAHNIEPTDVETMFKLANVYVGLRNFQRAEELLSLAHDTRPDIETITKQLETVRSFVDVESSSDPVLKALAQSQIAMDEGNQSQAQSIIAQALQANPDDTRLIVAMANVLVRQGQFDQAKAYIEQGLRIEPENRSLLGLQTAAAIGNDPEAAIEHIAQLDVPELDKQLKRFRVYRAAGDVEGAAAALEAARAIDPTNKQVVIASFDEALRNEDYDLAEKIYNENADRDIDGAKGLAMRARVELARGKIDEAERTLEAAVERGSTNPVTLRLLAQVQYQLGDIFKALENYKQAIALRPNDIDLTKGYLVTLMQLNRLEEALNTARTAAPIGQQDPEFREIWLTLEGLVGDKQMAYDKRKELAQAEPDNTGNTANLIRLAMDLRQFDEARQMIDRARAEHDSLLLASLDADWHAGRNDLQSAAQVFSDFIASDANDPDDPAAYLALGQFFIKYGAIENGLRTLRQALDLQDPDRPVADATLAEQLFRMQRYSEAIPHLEAMIAHNFQSQLARRRLIEALVRTGDIERAAQEIASLDEAEQHSLQILLLNSDIARFNGEDAKSMQLIDEAVTKFPDDPLAYMKRATRLMTTPATLPDALEDLTRAIELNPTNSEALRFRSMVLAELGRTDEAAKDVAAAAAARPNDTRLQLQAVQRLIDLDRASDAAALVDKLLKQQPSNLSLMLGAGDIFTRAGNPQAALTYYSQAWEQSKTVSVAQRVVSSLLDASRPDVRRARQIAESPEIADSSNPTVLLLRAKVESAAKRPAAVTALLDSAYELVKNDPNKLAVMFNQLEDLLGSPGDALAYLERLEQERSLTAWGSIFRAQLMLAEPDEREAGLRLLSQTIESSNDTSVKFAGYKIRAFAEYADGDYQAAADDMQRGLELFPDDADLCNNLAYTLARHLNRASEALTYAQKAVQLTPNSKNTLDTLGLVQSEMGQNEEALTTLRRALSLAQSDADKALVLIHIAETQVRSGNIQDAEETAEQARRIMAGRLDEFTDENRQELEAVLAKIENAK